MKLVADVLNTRIKIFPKHRIIGFNNVSLSRVPTITVREGELDRHPGYKKCGVVAKKKNSPVTDAPAYCRTTLQHCNSGRTPASQKRRPTSTDGYCEGETRNFRVIDTEGDTAMGRDSGSPWWVTKSSLMRQPSRDRLPFYRQAQKIAR